MQRGMALLGVIMALLLASLAVLASARSGLLHEMISGQQADQQAAQAMAEALVLDAEADIRGHFGNSPCRPSTNNASQTAPGFVGCRARGTAAVATAPYFPQSVEEFDEVRALVQVGAAVPCRDGICVPSTLSALATLGDPASDALTAYGVPYGHFTQAQLPPGTAAAQQGLRAWYWIEIFQVPADVPAPPIAPQSQVDPTRPFVYRITALAEGHKPGTRAVVKSLFVAHPSNQLP